MMVRFATTCDFAIDGRTCDKRSDEYEAWPTCRVCLNDICPTHMKPSTKTDADLDSPETCLCLECEEE